jgi:flagellin
MSSFGDLNRINTNLQAMNALLALNNINRSLGTTQLRLSTGLKINRAEDNAAGFSIASKLNARVAGLNQAMSNIGDAKSVLDVAESGFDSIMDQLVQMKALATQASNDTLGQAERNFIAKQITALGEDINEIANQTVFADKSLLKGDNQGNTGALTLTFQVGERAQDTITTRIQAVNVGMLFDGAGKGNAAGTSQLGATADAITVTPQGDLNSSSGGALTFATTAGSADFRAFISAIDDAITRMAERVNDIGVTQRSLSVREQMLPRAISSNSAAASRIMDTDFAKEFSELIRLQILQQVAITSLAQANMAPQSVLGFLR